MNETATIDTENEILEQVIEAAGASMSRETAETLLQFRFPSDAVDRMNDLAEKNRRGTIAPAERLLLERFVQVGNFLNLLHAKAHGALADLGSPDS